MERWRRILAVGWVGLASYAAVLMYATAKDYAPLSAWQYALYWFIVIGAATPLLSEISMRRAVEPRMAAVASDMHARGRHRFVSIEARRPFLGRPRLEARYAGGPFESVTIGPRSAANVSPATATDFWTLMFQVAQILTLAAYGRYLLVATSTLTHPIPNFRFVVRPRRTTRSSRHPGLPPWLVPRAGSDSGLVTRIASRVELAGLGPSSRIRSVTVRGGRLTIVAADPSERAIESTLTMVDIVHSVAGELGGPGT